MFCTWHLLVPKLPEPFYQDGFCKFRRSGISPRLIVVELDREMMFSVKYKPSKLQIQPDLYHGKAHSLLETRSTIQILPVLILPETIYYVANEIVISFSAPKCMHTHEGTINVSLCRKKSGSSGVHPINDANV